jgi:hypothetical protein
VCDVIFEVCVSNALAGYKSGLKMHLPLITSFCEILDGVAFFFFNVSCVVPSLGARMFRIVFRRGTI